MTAYQTVKSTDGTEIEYLEVGTGPGLVILHGTMQTATSQRELAELLSDSFTVYLSRRRNAAGTTLEGYCLQREVEDVEALLAKTGATNVLGISSGAVIALQAALTTKGIRKVAIFEPPLGLDPEQLRPALKRLESELAAGNTAAALVTGMLGAQLGPSFMKFIPRPLLVTMTKRMIAKPLPSGEPGFGDLASTLRYDFRLILEKTAAMDSFKGIATETLLLSATKSPKYLQAAVDGLEKVIPGAQRDMFPGFDHSVSQNAGPGGGKPEVVAPVLREFFGRA